MFSLNIDNAAQLEENLTVGNATLNAVRTSQTISPPTSGDSIHLDIILRVVLILILPNLPYFFTSSLFSSILLDLSPPTNMNSLANEQSQQSTTGIII